MGVIIVGSSSGNGAEVDTDHHLLVNPRAPAFGALGYYGQTILSGLITATLGAGSDLFSLQWTNASDFMVIQSVWVSAVVTATITSSVPFDLSLFFARSYTVAASGGTSKAPAASMQMLRTSMGNSLVTVAQVAATGALTAGTRTLDNNPLGRVQGITGTVTGTVFFAGNTPVPLFQRQTNDQHPIVLKQNEGIVIQNPLAGPATGTFSILVGMVWGEVAAY